MSEDKTDKTIGWRPSKEAQELLTKVTGKDRKKLLDKLVADEAKRQHEISASPCEIRTIDWVDTLKTHYVPYFEKRLKEDESMRGLSEYSTEHVAYDTKEINWAKYWIEHYRTKCVCGSKRGHEPKDQGDFKTHPEWVAAAKSYQPPQ